MSDRTPTQAKNALARAGITDPYSVTLQDLLRVKGLGPKGIYYLARKGYPPQGSRYHENKES